MNAFPLEPILRVKHPRACRGKQLYVLERDFTYISPAFGDIIAPAGMSTDFASIPRIAYSYISPESPQILWPAIIHDALYATSGVTESRTFTREEADAVLREAMLACGARKTQAWLVHKAVRMFGGGHWKSLP